MNRTKVALSLTFLMAAGLSGCDRLPGTPQSGARAALSRMLFDPGSAQIKYTAVTSTAVCGSVNAKNRMGGYVGERAYYNLIGSEYVVVQGSGPDDSDWHYLSNTETTDPGWRSKLDEVTQTCSFPKQWKIACGSAPVPSVPATCAELETTGGFMKLMERYRY